MTLTVTPFVVQIWIHQLTYPIDYFAWANGYTDGNYYSDRYYTFTPGDGQCQPLNPFGTYAASPEAQDFITERLTDELEVEQFVLNVTAVGSFDVLGGLLDGPIGYAAGVSSIVMSQVTTVSIHSHWVSCQREHHSSRSVGQLKCLHGCLASYLSTTPSSSTRRVITT